MLHLCCRQEEFHIHILLQVKVPNKVTVRRSLQACTQSPRTVLLCVTGVRGYWYKPVDGKDFWSSQTWPWFEPVLWISSLSFKQPSEIRGYCCSCFQNYACTPAPVTADMLVHHQILLSIYLSVSGIFGSISQKQHCLLCICESLNLESVKHSYITAEISWSLAASSFSGRLLQFNKLHL